eukprot:7607438-Pyramimonas_sp.AAC.1
MEGRAHSKGHIFSERSTARSQGARRRHLPDRARSNVAQLLLWPGSCAQSPGLASKLLKREAKRSGGQSRP